MWKTSTRIFSIYELDANAQKIIFEQIKNHLEKTGSVYSDEWEFSKLSHVKIEIDLSQNMG